MSELLPARRLFLFAFLFSYIRAITDVFAAIFPISWHVRESLSVPPLYAAPPPFPSLIVIRIQWGLRSSLAWWPVGLTSWFLVLVVKYLIMHIMSRIVFSTIRRRFSLFFLRAVEFGARRHSPPPPIFEELFFGASPLLCCNYSCPGFFFPPSLRDVPSSPAALRCLTTISLTSPSFFAPLFSAAAPRLIP